MASKPQDEKRPVGRPIWLPDEKEEAQVQALCATGAPHRLISWYMQKDIKTLKRHFPEAFEETNRENKTDMVEYSLFHQAVYKGNVTACIIWLKAHKPELYADKVVSTDDPAALKAEIMAELAGKLPD